jgi:hypothetical protein
MLARARETYRHHGLARAMFDQAYTTLNRVTECFVLRAMTLTRATVDDTILTVPSRFTAGFLDPSTVRVLARDATTQLDAPFLDYALGRGDECYAILDGDRLTSYGWYSRLPTRMTPKLDVAFGPAWIYMYRGYTSPDYRGLRLHALGMGGAMLAYSARGSRGLISYVEANNFNSLASVARLGYRIIGTAVALRIGGRYLLHADRGCAAEGFAVVPRVVA